MFRPLEMFKNLVHAPHKVSEFELYCLDQRRKMEKQLILDKDLQNQEDEDEEQDTSSSDGNESNDSKYV